MKKDDERLLVDFNQKAQMLFNMAYRNFRLATKKLDRQLDENVFQLQVEKFSVTLKHQLKKIAYDILTISRTSTKMNQFNKQLQETIDIYMKEFRQKIRSL